MRSLPTPSDGDTMTKPTPNPVVRGYRWSQQFICPDGTLEPFDELRSEIYASRDKFKHSNPVFVISSSTAGVIADGQTIQVDLTPAQTNVLRNWSHICLDFKRTRDGVETYLGVKATFPIREPLTKGYSP